MSLHLGNPTRGILLVLLSITATASGAIEVPVAEATVDATGRARLRVSSDTDHYYVLYRSREHGNSTGTAVSISIGQPNQTTLTDPLGAHGPTDLYHVEEYSLDAPADIDGDGLDDMEEYLSPGRLNPLNPARKVPIADGASQIPDRASFRALSYQGENVLIDTHLRDLEFKFYVLNSESDHPELLFMNTQTHRAHSSFAGAIMIPGGRVGGRPIPGPALGSGPIPGQLRGVIVYHPQVTAPSGQPGTYRFEFEPNDAIQFEQVRMVYELLGASMPFLENNLAYYPMPSAALPLYYQQKHLYDSSRVEVLLDQDIYREIEFVPLNPAVGFGVLRRYDPETPPGQRDIVILDTLPNDIPRVAGVITTVPQTPLSHVNLRAIQDRIPNAYVKEGEQIDSLSHLIGSHVRFEVLPQSFEIREASAQEVEAHLASLRPPETQMPVRDLSVQRITPLDQVTFQQSSSFGVKAANVATLRTLDPLDAMVPDGYAVPFYFYDEFMKFNSLYDVARYMIADSRFQADRGFREQVLRNFRQAIEAGVMPDWMVDALSALQRSFPVGTPIRVRSSTNNEDLPGFSGAGLYTSRTHHLREGHIAKTVKEVFAGLWNFRAYEAREFSRIDHFSAAMGLLVHPNYTGELANGVGVTTNPFSAIDGVYYVNSQIGEDLVTNPDPLSTPEELLISTRSLGGYRVIRSSSLSPDDQRVLSASDVEQLRQALSVIEAAFRDLYGVGAAEDFAMEIEFKIDSAGNLVIKQARPWVW